MKYALLSSGSAGNSTLICTEKTAVLIDCGLTKAKLSLTLASCGYDIAGIDRVLITHGHSDHVSGLRFLPKEKWMTSPDAISEPLGEEQYFSVYEPFAIGDLRITALPLSHDAASTVGFLIESGGESLAYVTDTGYLKDKVMDYIKDATYYIFESNHDTKMLYTSDRSAYLIRRIHSDIGHLDNVAASTYLSSLIGKHTREVTLAHLSEECNTPELAEETYRRVMMAQLGYLPDVLLRCGSIENVVKGGGFLK